MLIKNRELLIEYKSKGSCLVTVHSLEDLITHYFGWIYLRGKKGAFQKIAVSPGEGYKGEGKFKCF